MSTLSDLTAEIATQLPTGVSHEITAAKLRLVLTDMVNSLSAPGTVSGGGTADRYLTSSTTANAGDVCFCNTSAGGFTVTLPAAPIPGTGIGFRDAESSWSAANLTISPGINNIENVSGNLVCDVTNANFDLVWSGSAAGWQVVFATSFFGGSGGGVSGGGANYYHVTSNLNAAAGNIYYCDTLGGSFTATLPTGPALGTGISFRDASGHWGTSNLLINPGANPINSVVSTLAVDQSDINFDLVWRGAPVGWQVEIAVNNSARGVAGSAGFLTTKPLGGLTQVLTATRGGAISWNPTDKHSNIVLSGSNLIATATASAASLGVPATSVRATAPGSAGRYFEIVWGGSSLNGFGVATSSQSLNTYTGNPAGIGFFHDGYVEWPGSGFSTNMGITFAVGDVMGLLLGTSNVQLFKNGTLAYTVSVLPSGPLFPILSASNAGETATANFGATAMSFLPSGATSWDGSRTSAGVVTWNAADNSGTTLSNGNLTATGTGTGGGQVRGTRAGSVNRYFEVHIDADARSGSVYVGLANASQSLTSGYAGNPNGISYFDNGYAEFPGSGSGGTGATYTAGNTIGVLLLTSTAQFYKGGVLQFTANLPPGPLLPIVGLYDATTSAVTANFGATSFLNLPSGASGWNT